MWTAPPPHPPGVADLYTDRPPGVADLYTGRSGGERVAARRTVLAGGAAVLLQSRLHIGHRLQTRTAVGCIHLPPEETIDGSTHCIAARFSWGGGGQDVKIILSSEMCQHGFGWQALKMWKI